VHHCQRRRRQERRDEIAIAGDVDAVVGDAAEAEPAGEPGGVHVVAGAGDGAGTERHGVGLVGDAREALDVAAQRRRVGQPHVRRQHGLRPAHVRVRRHHRVAGELRLRHAGLDHRRQRPPHLGDAPLEIETHVHRHLLVARPPGVQPLAGVADAGDELAFHERVHVLVAGAIEEAGIGGDGAADVVEAGDERRDVALGQHPGPAERLGPGLAAGDVLVHQAPIDGERLAELEDRGVGRLGESSGPERVRRHGRQYGPRPEPRAESGPVEPGGGGALRDAISTGRPQIFTKPAPAA
jgi:hypothetical protein